MKKGKSVHFIKSAVTADQYPKHTLPEIAFIGRSNVGKSSLLNTLLRRKNLALVSNTPGKTRLINFFDIDEALCFVDLPGYGYAKVPESVRKQWKPMIETYLRQRENLKEVVLIIDCRHEPTEQDIIMRDWLRSYKIPTIIVATKIDKLSKSQWQKQQKIIHETLHMSSEESLLPFSSLKAEGVKPVWQAILHVIE